MKKGKWEDIALRWKRIYIYHMSSFMAISGYVFAVAYIDVRNNWGKIPD